MTPVAYELVPIQARNWAYMTPTLEWPQKACILLVLHYTNQICTCKPTFTISSLTVHHFIITAVSLSSKSHDVFCTNIHYVHVGSLALVELACLEHAFSLLWAGEPAPVRSSYSTTSTSSHIPVACSTSYHPLLTPLLLPLPLLLLQLMPMWPTTVIHPLLALLGVHQGAILASRSMKLCSIHLRMALLRWGTLDKLTCTVRAHLGSWVTYNKCPPCQCILSASIPCHFCF